MVIVNTGNAATLRKT